MNQVLGVIGSPISHSLSPVMHEAAYEELQLNCSYHAFHVESTQLKSAVEGVRSLGLKGINVTIPHKVDVIQYLDHIDPLAEEIGAVNTIVNDQGVLKGYNTDGDGYVYALLQRIGKTLHDKRILIVGAGGAAKGVALCLSKYGVKKMTITNRTSSKAEDLAVICSQYSDTDYLSLGMAQAELAKFDIMINTTSIGMAPNFDQMPLSLENLRKGAFVSDLIYNPYKTKLLIEAENKGSGIMNGVDMFVHQGALAFKKWFNKEAPVQIMKNSVIKHLGGSI